MTKFRESLPQLNGDFFLTDGGLETTLIFLEGLELPDFAAFDLLKSETGKTALRKYYLTYAKLAQQFETGLILETPTWRANADWGTKLGYSKSELAEVNQNAINLLARIRAEFKGEINKIVISGCVGPRGDGYHPNNKMSETEAANYHGDQIQTFEQSGADMVTAITMNYVEEAIGIALAAKQANLPVAISFTVETDGNLPTGQSLRDAIPQVDAATASYPAYYMINCAHPTHFDQILEEAEPWMQRIRGVRANASHKSHAELDESIELDFGDPVELGQQHAELKRRLPLLNVMGGCCGTDQRHVEQIAATCSSLFNKRVDR